MPPISTAALAIFFIPLRQTLQISAEFGMSVLKIKEGSRNPEAPIARFYSLVTRLVGG